MQTQRQHQKMPVLNVLQAIHLLKDQKNLLPVQNVLQESTTQTKEVHVKTVQKDPIVVPKEQQNVRHVELEHTNHLLVKQVVSIVQQDITIQIRVQKHSVHV